jgi:hypothetical protein
LLEAQNLSLEAIWPGVGAMQPGRIPAGLRGLPVRGAALTGKRRYLQSHELARYVLAPQSVTPPAAVLLDLHFALRRICD